MVSTYGYSDAGGRTKNEDNGGIYVYPDRIIAVAADGLGGQGEGSTASLLAVEALSRCGAEEELPDREILQTYFRKANEAIRKKQQNQFHMKTTAVYLCVWKNHAVWAHIGDSRLYHLYQNKICHFTLDHSIPQISVLLGEIERKDIPKHPQRNRLTKALGCEEAEPEIQEPVLLQQGRHAFLLCTDGFWEYLDEEELEETADKAETAEEWIAGLRRRIAERCGSGQDNNTAIAVILQI